MRTKSLATFTLIVALAFLCPVSAIADGETVYRTPPQYVLDRSVSGAFRIAADGQTAPVYVDPQDWPGVIRAAKDLGDDIRKVTGTPAAIVEEITPGSGSIVVGTIGKSRIIDRLIAEKKIDVSEVAGKWESFLIQTVDGNLIVAGSDKRGTIFGIYDISEKIGVSPWYYWADAPVKQSSALYVRAGRYLQDPPKVKYRGIFINQENPSFNDWSRANFGGVNSRMYVHMFELLLRLKANYMWPAMWGKSFFEDDPMSPVKADEYGIIMGTSHHEPMMRAHADYKRDVVGPWDYATNAENLKLFFAEGIERSKNYENVITISMRGEGDVALGTGDDEENIRVLRQVVEDQREIISRIHGKEAAEVPQTWPIFTEVQRYYDAGFTVPDDVLLMFCDNNWGFIRRIGPPHEQNRSGGLGLYYHIDMNGGPWCDRWINTTTIPKLREQFALAYETGIDDLWIVNVGDLKPKELPIDFILRYAWNPDAYPADKLFEYTVNWAENIFGEEHAEEIAEIVSLYPKYNLWRKPEVQAVDIYSFVNYHEADRVRELWRDLTARAESLQSKIPAEAQDAYYQLVLYPVKASAGVAEIYLDAGQNNLYARQGRVSANDYADRARELFALDKELSDYYMSPAIAGGKWVGMMQDSHIGYTNWSMPQRNALPPMTEVTPLGYPSMGIAVEGSESAWPGSNETAVLPTFDALNKKNYYVDVFNRGTGAFAYKAETDRPWIKVIGNTGSVDKESRILIDVDWNALPDGKSEGTVTFTQGDTAVPVRINVIKAPGPDTREPYFGTLTGEFSIPAYGFNANIPGRAAKWIELPDLGRGKANMGIYPVTAPSETEAGNAPWLEYNVFFPVTGKVTVCLGILPTQDVFPARGLRIAVALDGETPQVIDARKGFVDTFSEYTEKNLSRSNVLKPLPRRNDELALTPRRPRRNEVFDNLRWLDLELDVKEAGIHSLKVFMVDPEIVLETIVVNPDNAHPSYFGAPTVFHDAK